MTIELGATRIELYDTIRELPVMRYQKFQEYSLLDTGIGKDINDVGTHFAKLDSYLVNEDMDSAIQERKNMHKNFFYMFLNANITSYSFCCLVKTIDGEALPLNEDEFDKTVAMLQSLAMPFTELEDAVIDLKKNYIQR